MNGYADGLSSLAGYFGWLFLITMQIGYADNACWQCFICSLLFWLCWLALLAV
jgi:hypothetical protein